MTLQEAINKIKGYLPGFIVSSEELESIITAAGKSFVSLKAGVDSLGDADWAGKGLRKLADKEHVFYNGGDTDEAIRARLEDRYLINSIRGTEAGITDDLTALLGTAPDIEFHAGEVSIVDEIIVGDKYSFLGRNKVIILNNVISIITSLYGEAVYGESYYSAEVTKNVETIKRKIMNEIVPYDCQVIYGDDNV
jgi:hypothetical protein